MILQSDYNIEIYLYYIFLPILMVNSKERTTCRVCGNPKLVPILSLGNQCVTNFVESTNEEPLRGPLDLVLCSMKDNGCGLLQLKDTTDQDSMYRKYWYKSGISTTMVKALKNVVECSEKLVKLNDKDIVVDIGANDGTLLRHYDNRKIQTIGFEPSNLFQLGEEGNTKIIHDYFNAASFEKEFPGKKAKVITAVAMFYDLEDPNKFVDDIKKVLDKDGVFLIQMNYLVGMLENNTFDNISHEHLEYYSLLALENLLQRHNLEIFDIELNDVNGGSIRTYVRHKGSSLTGFPGAEVRLFNQRDVERKLGLEDIKVYQDFSKRIETIKTKLVDTLTRLKQEGKKVYIYGASTRGLVVLQYAGIDNKLIDFAIDKNPDKEGKYIVGTGIPIISVDEYRNRKPDYLFVLPFQFLTEIGNQEINFLRNGGKLIVALPEFKIIDYDNLPNKKMKVLLTGNHGFIGYIIAYELLKKGHEVTGWDCDFFPEEVFGRQDAYQASKMINQITKDLRDITVDDLRGFDAVIHLAALPNDPACDLDPRATEDINYLTTVQVATAAKRAGVKKFIFSSSCAAYGVKGDQLIVEGHVGVPLTVYAHSKINSENALSAMDDDSFTVSFMRNATAYGVSPRMRFDMVLNNLVGFAYTEGKVKMLSDGTSWRPIVHIEDIAQAFILVLEAPRSLVATQVFNVCSENFIVKQIAEIVKKVVPGCEVEIAAGATKDWRSYNVGFEKLKRVLGYKPKWNAVDGAKELYEAYKKFGLNKDNFKGSDFLAGSHYKKLLTEGKLTKDFRLKSLYTTTDSHKELHVAPGKAFELDGTLYVPVNDKNVILK